MTIFWHFQWSPPWLSSDILSGKSSDILSGISCGMLSGKSSDILSPDILPGLSANYGHIKKHLVISSDPHHDYLLTFPVIPTITIFWQFIWLILWHSLLGVVCPTLSTLSVVGCSFSKIKVQEESSTKKSRTYFEWSPSWVASDISSDPQFDWSPPGLSSDVLSGKASDIFSIASDPFCYWCSRKQRKMVSRPLCDANDALLGVIQITCITKPLFWCFPEPIFFRSPPPGWGIDLQNVPECGHRHPHPHHSLRSP